MNLSFWQRGGNAYSDTFSWRKTMATKDKARTLATARAVHRAAAPARAPPMTRAAVAHHERARHAKGLGQARTATTAKPTYRWPFPLPPQHYREPSN